VCMCVCVCVCVCVCCRSHSDHQFTAVNVCWLMFLIDNINTVIKPTIVKIKLSTTVLSSRNQAAPHCMLAFCLREAARTATVVFALFHVRAP